MSKVEQQLEITLLCVSCDHLGLLVAVVKLHSLQTTDKSKKSFIFFATPPSNHGQWPIWPHSSLKQHVSMITTLKIWKI